MTDIRIHRNHELGLARARKVASRWAEEVHKKFDMQCSVLQGETSDTVQFTRSGVNGQLIVAADHFDLEARLGFLLGAFRRVIEGEIEKELDTLLSRQSANASKTPRRRAAATTGNYNRKKK